MNSFPFIYPEVLTLKSKLIEIRRFLHENPEISFQEFGTSAYIVEHLESFGGFSITKNVGKTGVTAFLQGSTPGPTILLRADMDALPMQEETELPFKSKNNGVHHSCGHDGHVAILLITAMIISEKFKGQLKGNIKFVFQPAEEDGYGAHAMIIDEKNPVLINPKVDQCFGLHLNTLDEVGRVRCKPGAVSAWCHSFAVRIKGSGGHGSAPHLSKDPIYVAAQLIDNFYSITSKDINPCNKCVISVGMVHAGTANNVIPSESEFSGTFRCVEDEDKNTIMKRMKELINGFSVAFEVEIQIEFDVGYPAIINHVEETKLLIECCEAIVGKENVAEPNFVLYGEDFSFFVQKTPGAFFQLGAAPENSLKENKPIMHHHPLFTFNEESLLVGVSIWIKLIEKLLVL